MSANETVHTSASGGQKAGNDERYDLIPTEPWRRLAIHAGTAVLDGRPGSYHQMMAHAWKFWAGEDADPMTDWNHLIAAAWEAMRIVDPCRTYFDDNRPGPERYDRIPAEAARQLALHFGVGARKYDDDNWLRGYDWRLTFAAANRHAEQYRAGETHDPETGSHHLIAFAWHMLVLDEFTRWYPQYDTRTATKRRAWVAAAEQYDDADRKERTRRMIDEVLRLPKAPAAHDGCADGGRLCDPPAAMLNDITVNGADELIDQAPGLRVVETLGETEQNAVWRDRDGDLHRYRNGDWEWHRGIETPDDWRYFDDRHVTYGPFTEVVPRVVKELTPEHKTSDWYDKDHDHWRWIDDGHGAGWSMFCSRSLGTWDTSRTENVPSFGPFTEAL